MQGYLMSNASNVVIVPGYGMAQGRAQNAVKRLRPLKEEGVNIRFADSSSCRSYARAHERAIGRSGCAL